MNICKSTNSIDYARELIRAGSTQKITDREIANLAQLIDQEKAQAMQEYAEKCRKLEKKVERLNIVIDALADHISANQMDT